MAYCAATFPTAFSTTATTSPLTSAAVHAKPNAIFKIMRKPEPSAPTVYPDPEPPHHVSFA